MTVYVFVGPTLRPDEARAELDAVYLPPVSQGDVYRAARAGAQAIGIVDGYFERIPAVWHKEILWAMAEGVHVFGSASMGALRAAELAAFGMVGVGSIFDAFASGLLEDDDEVAVAHGPAETGFRAVSDAMVNIRATLAAARGEAIISNTTAATLERIAKALFYPDRAYATILRLALDEPGVVRAELAGFEAWLPTGRVDQKRQDAVSMLRAMREHLSAKPPPKRVRYTFERTVWWEHAAITAGELHTDTDGSGEAVLLDALLEEAQLDGTRYAQAYDGALLGFLAARYANEASAAPGAAFHQTLADRFRRRHGLLRGDDVERWLIENRLTRERFTELLREQALSEWTASELAGDVNRRLPDQLRLTGQYAALLERARHKQRTLAESGWDNPSLDAVGLTREGLMDWFFQRTRQPVEADLEDYARRIGFADSDGLVRALLREFCYVRCLKQEVGDESPALAR